MRVKTIIVALAVVGYWTGPTATANTSPVKWWTGKQKAKLEQVAVELNCGESDDYRQYDCSQDLIEEFTSGRAAPEPFIGERCRQLESSWAITASARAESICEEYLGRPFVRS